MVRNKIKTKIFFLKVGAGIAPKKVIKIKIPISVLFFFNTNDVYCSPWTFLPVILYEQFKFFFNLYFLLVALSQFIPVLKIGKEFPQQ